MKISVWARYVITVLCINVLSSGPVIAAETESIKGYTGCTQKNQIDNTCLPNITEIEKQLDDLSEDKGVRMDVDRHSWRGLVETLARPSDDAVAFLLPSDLVILEDLLATWDFPNYAFDRAKKHVQSIQYIENTEGKRFLITSLGDETATDSAALQLIQTDEFAAGAAGSWDDIAEQYLLNYEQDWSVHRYNHPGGSQLIGSYLFLALEDFTNFSEPLTGVWKINPDLADQSSDDDGSIQFMYRVRSTAYSGFSDDYHQSTAAVTRLADETFLLAVCVGEHGCDHILFLKSEKKSLEKPASDTTTGPWRPDFELIYEWNRETSTDWVGEQVPVNDYWSDCAPQNMNFAVNTSGDIYLVMFGGENRGIQSGKASGCNTGSGFDDHLYGYKIVVDKLAAGDDSTAEEDYEVKFDFTNKVDVMPNPSVCDESVPIGTGFFHGLNFLAGSGLWLSPNGNGEIAFLATEHYDSCRTYKRPVNGKTRWGVSSNWSGRPLITVDNYTVEVNEGESAENSGAYEFVPLSVNRLFSASVGTVIETDLLTKTWNWDWLTSDGPEDTQLVEIDVEHSIPIPILGGFHKVSDTVTFNLKVNNVAPTADAGPDQIVECAHGGQLALNATGSTDPGDDVISYSWDFVDFPGSVAPEINNPLAAMPMFTPTSTGVYEARVAVTDEDGLPGGRLPDTDTAVINYVDSMPPVISNVSATPDVLWSPNGKMVPVQFTVTATDQCDLTPTCQIAWILSSDADNDEVTHTITGALTADLRVKRHNSGGGRVYTAGIVCEDASENLSFATTTVTVPSIARLVTTPDREADPDYGWVVFGNGMKVWVDASCRGRLNRRGLSTQSEPWPGRIATYADAPSMSCNTLSAMLPGATAQRIVTTPDRSALPDYGWVVFSDNTKQWIDADCRGQLTSLRLPTSLEPWSQISTYLDRPAVSCDELF